MRVGAHLRLVVPLQRVVSAERLDFLYARGPICAIMFPVVRSILLVLRYKV